MSRNIIPEDWEMDAIKEQVYLEEMQALKEQHFWEWYNQSKGDVIIIKEDGTTYKIEESISEPRLPF